MTAPDPTAGEPEPSPSTLWPHGPIVGHPKHDYYVCGSCHGPLGPGPCPAKMPTQPNPPTFDSLLSDPTQQLDSEGVVIRSIAASTGTSEDVEALVAWLVEQGGSPGSSLHSWRCEHPDRYGECDCLTESARDLLASDWLAAREAAARAEEREALVVLDGLLHRWETVPALRRATAAAEVRRALGEHLARAAREAR